MTEKRFNLWDIEGTAFIEDHKEGSYHIGKTEDVDLNSLRNITKRLNIYAEENEQLKKVFRELITSGYWDDDYLTEQDWNDLKRYIENVFEKVMMND